MDIRKYEASNIQDAIKLVKKELGRDAIILSTREKETTVQGSGKKCKVVEVVATQSVTSTSMESSATPQTTADGKPIQAVTFPHLQRTSDIKIVRGSPTMSGSRPTGKVRQPAVAPGKAPQTGATSTQQTDSKLSRILQRYGNLPEGATSNQGTESSATPFERTSGASTADMAQRNNHAESIRTDGDIAHLREELGRMRSDLEMLPHINLGNEVQEIKILLHDLMRNRDHNDEWSKYHEYLNSIAIKLRAAGVLEPILTQLLEMVSGMPIPTSPDGEAVSGEKLKEFYINSFIRNLFKQIKISGPWKQNDGQQQLMCFVGPTGVGKTTTLAKIAAGLKLSGHKKVAFASMDTFRIAGADQLRIYSKILDCPFGEISEISDLVKFVRQYHDYDSILIDTAGRSVRHLWEIESLKTLTASNLPIHFHLVVSSCMKQRDIDENLRAFKFLAPESIVFTKLDESWSYGEILNTAVRSGIPLSWFTNGQRVPEDLELASKERIIERLFQI